MAHVKVVGVLAEMLIETGQAMQRGGLKLIGRRVVKHDPFITIGARRPFTANGSLVHLTSTLTGGAVTVQKHVAVGAGSVLRSESELVAIGPDAVIGEKVVMTAQVARSLTGLPPMTQVGSKCVIGDNTVLVSCMIYDTAKVGKNCVIGEGAVVEPGAEVADDSVVPPGCLVPAGEHWGGNPVEYLGQVEHDH